MTDTRTIDDSALLRWAERLADPVLGELSGRVAAGGPGRAFALAELRERFDAAANVPPLDRTGLSALLEKIRLGGRLTEVESLRLSATDPQVAFGGVRAPTPVDRTEAEARLQAVRVSTIAYLESAAQREAEWRAAAQGAGVVPRGSDKR